MTTIIDGSAGITYPNSTVQASAGVVLQVVQGTYSTQTSTSSTSYVTTSLNASITPKFATSKILAIVSLGWCQNASASYMNATLYRSSTDLAPNVYGFGVLNSNASVNGVNINFNYLDSPATTSSTTYTVYAKSNSGTVYWCVSGQTAVITLMEIAG